MEILRRTLSTEYEAFHRSVEGELNLDITYEPGGGEEFGRSRVALKSSTADIFISLELPDDAFSHTAAHELAHVLQSLRGYYKPSVSSELPEDSAEANISIRLDEAIECIAVDRLTAQYGLDASYAVNARYRSRLEALRKAQRSSPALGTPQFGSEALQYIRASFEQPAERWERLRRGFELKLPDLVGTAEELRQRVLVCGTKTVDQRRDAMLILRDGLCLQGKVFVANPLTGHWL